MKTETVKQLGLFEKFYYNATDILFYKQPHSIMQLMHNAV